MRRVHFILISFVILIFFMTIVAIFPICKIKVANGQKMTVYKISLPAKIGSFVYREQIFKQLVGKIVQDANTDEEKVLAIYEWVKANIRDIPIKWELPSEGHEFNIIIRGYATPDDKARIFCILTTFAGYPGIRTCGVLKYGQQKQAGMISAVHLNGRWLYFDLANDIYFRYNGRLASIEDIKKHPGDIMPNREKAIPDRSIFAEGVKHLKNIEVKDPYFTRGHLQMLFPRIRYEFLRRVYKRGILYDYLCQGGAG